MSVTVKTSKQTALDQGQTDCLTFNPLQAMAMIYSHADVQGQRSVGSEDRVETNGRTDGRTDGRRRLHYLTRKSSQQIFKF